MTDLPPFPDIEAVLLDLLDDLGSTGTATPPNLVSALPFIRIARIGGGDDYVTDSSRVDIDAFGATRPDAYALAEAIRQRLLGWPIVATGAVIDKVVVDVGPHEIPWGDSNVRRFTAAFTITARRPL